MSADVENLLLQAFSAYEDDRLAAACSALDEICKLLQLPSGFPFEDPSLPPSSANAVPELKEAQAAFASDTAVQHIRKEGRELQWLTETIQNDDGWTEITNHEHIQTLWRQEPNASTVSIKVRGEVDSNIFNVLALANEVDLVGTFIPRVHCRKLKQVSRFRQLVHVLVHLPWPLSHRDVVLEGHGIDLLEQGRVVIIAKSYQTPSASPTASASSPTPTTRPPSQSTIGPSPAPKVSPTACAKHQQQDPNRLRTQSEAKRPGGDPLPSRPLTTDADLPPVESAMHSAVDPLDPGPCAVCLHEEQLAHQTDSDQKNASSTTESGSISALSVADQLLQKRQNLEVIKAQWNGVQFPEPDSGVTRADVILAGAILEPIDQNRTRLYGVSNVDLKLGFIPMSVVNFFTKQLAYYGFLLFRKQAHMLKGSEHEKRIQQKRDVYGVIEDRLKAYWQSKAAQL